MKVNNNKIGSPTVEAAKINSSKTHESKKNKGIDDLFSTDLKQSARIDFSERTQDIKKAKEIASQGLNDVDEAKVAKFQALIDGGKYSVDAAKIADRMVDEHLSNEFAAGETKD